MHLKFALNEQGTESKKRAERFDPYDPYAVLLLLLLHPVHCGTNKYQRDPGPMQHYLGVLKK